MTIYPNLIAPSWYQPGADIDAAVPATYTRQEAADRIGIGLTTMNKLIRDGDVKVIKIRTRTVIKHDEIEKYLGRRERGEGRGRK